MRESGCKVSRVLLLVSVLLLVALRVAPHHHCSENCGMSVALSSVHFGFEDCGGCSHGHGDGREDEHPAVLCYDASLFYFRSTDADSFSERIIQPSLPGYMAILDSEVPENHLSRNFFADGVVPDIPDVMSVTSAMRAPPVIFFS